MLSDSESLIEKAKALAYALGMRIYIRDGKIYQHPPGEEIIPHPNHNPMPHGPMDVADVDTTTEEDD